MPESSEASLIDLEVYRLVRASVDLYNKYRSPESTASIVSIYGERLVVRFEGSFCHTCGINDWVEDLVYIMRDVGLDAELVEVLEPEDPWELAEWRLGVFRVKKRAGKGGGQPGPLGFHHDLEDRPLSQPD